MIGINTKKKMESNKYYIPEIEEFHQGFEYEVWYSSAYTEEKWIKETFEFYDKDEIYHYDCVDLIPSFKNYSDSIRVKYLDREDIESLGWKMDLVRSKIIGNFAGKLNNFYLQYYPYLPENGWDNGLIYNPLRVVNVIKFNTNPENKQHLFNGIIKNKSELRKLMKQLDIYGTN